MQHSLMHQMKMSKKEVQKGTPLLQNMLRLQTESSEDIRKVNITGKGINGHDELFFEPFPYAVNLNGINVPVITDFREWIRFYDMLHSQDITDIEKASCIRAYYMQEIDSKDINEFLPPLIDFFCMKKAYAQDGDIADGEDEEIPDPSQKKALYDFKIDSRFIISGFLQDYNIDLLKIKYLHWWHFRILLDGLSSGTEFKQRVMYRNANPAEIKDKKERERIIKIQRAIAIPQPPPSDFETGDMFW